MNKTKTLISRSVEDTFRIAREYAAGIGPGTVICLHGNLGAGKTHFAKGFVTARGIPAREVDSPTFTIINEYDGEIPIYHFDCYRINDPDEILEIGGEEYLYGSGICLVEWPEKIAEILPEDARHVFLDTLSENERTISFQRQNTL